MSAPELRLTFSVEEAYTALGIGRTAFYKLVGQKKICFPKFSHDRSSPRLNSIAFSPQQPTKLDAASDLEGTMSVAIIPATRRWRLYLEHEAIRIFGGLAGSTRSKVERRLMADARKIGVDADIASADVAEAMVFLEGRISLYEAARAAPPPVSRGRTG